MSIILDEEKKFDYTKKATKQRGLGHQIKIFSNYNIKLTILINNMNNIIGITLYVTIRDC